MPSLHALLATCAASVPVLAALIAIAKTNPDETRSNLPKWLGMGGSPESVGKSKSESNRPGPVFVGCKSDGADGLEVAPIA